MLGASVIFTNYPIRRKRLGKNSTTTTSAATASYPITRPVITCLHFGRSGRALGCRSGFV
jgi:hypothetical protein